MFVIEKARMVKRWLKNIVFSHEKSGIKVKIPILKKIKYNILGFTDLQYVTYDLEHNDYKNYISMKERYRLENINGRFAFLLGEKVMFERVFGKYVNVPHIYCWVKNGRFIDLENQNECDLLKAIRDTGKLIAKPTRSLGGGQGVHEFTYEGNSYKIDGKIIEEDKLICLAKDFEEYIVVQFIDSAGYSKAVCSKSTNTMRIVTVINREKNEIDVLFAFHRFGTTKSSPVDNISSGGLFALIDETTGICGNAKSLFDLDKNYSVHPETGTEILGLHIPNWDNIIEELKKAHCYFPYYEFFAWDVAISSDGRLYVLEINRGSDLSIQIIKPMRKEKLGIYMRKYGLLDKW